ncbi:MAG: transcriptional regulator [Betaproteobacteria bacterium]
MLSSDFKSTVATRVKRDPKYRAALLAEALNACLSGDTGTGKAVIRDIVGATVGIDGLAAKMKRPSNGVRRMLARSGVLTARDFFAMVNALRQTTRIRIRVTARRLTKTGNLG